MKKEAFRNFTVVITVLAMVLCIVPIGIGALQTTRIANAEIADGKSNIKFKADIFDETDLLIMVAKFVKGEFSSPYPEPMSYEELYSIRDEVLAYKVVLSNDFYVIVNANRENPVWLEFGEIDQNEVSQSNEKSIEVHATAYYLGPGCIATKDEVRTALSTRNVGVSHDKLSSDVLDYENRFLQFCEAENEIANKRLKEAKMLVSSRITKMKDTDDKYDFIIDSVPAEGCIQEKNLAKYADFKYGTTSLFRNVNGAKNHCAATSAYNEYAYYRLIMGEPLSNDIDDMKEVFTTIHKRMGNGPVNPLQYRNRIKKFVGEDTVYHCDVAKPAPTFTKYQEYIDWGRMPVLCVMPALFDAPMINGTGYRVYSSVTYARIIDNWNNNPNKWYIFGEDLFAMSWVYIYK